jgi:hypothetical protein
MTDYAANLALFLTEKKGGATKSWTGHMTAAEQRALFGRFMGKGRIFIDGADETVEHYVKVCFGLDSECTKRANWRDL